jgi:hypothetical protein
MGDTIWIDVEGRAEDDQPSDRSMLLRFEKQLDELSEQLGVAKLTDFYDHSALAHDFSGLIEDDEEFDAAGVDAAPPAGSWFDPTTALSAIRTIRNHLMKRPDDLKFKADKSRQHWPRMLMTELEEAEQTLAKAASEKKRFRLLIVS